MPETLWNGEAKLVHMPSLALQTCSVLWISQEK